MKHLFTFLMTAVLAITAMAQVPCADYRVIPLPSVINGIKSADFRLTDQCLVNYPTGNRDMERNASMSKK